MVGIRKDFVLKNRWREKSKLHYYIKILYCFNFLIFIPKEEIKINFFPVISSEDENNLLEHREKRR